MLLRIVLILFLIFSTVTGCFAASDCVAGSGMVPNQPFEASVAIFAADQISGFTIQAAIAAAQNTHPIVIAGLLLFFVLGACFLLTDNKEIELYLKIDFRPPRTDILN